MSKICPTCNHEWPDNFQSCPLDSTPLINKAPTTSGLSLNLGDANAVSGGINLSDNHSINTTNTHNVDSHNVITNNITQIERERRPEEILLEKKQMFRSACQEVMKDGLVTTEAHVHLNNLQFNLGLDKSVAASIFDEVRSLSLQQRRLTTLGPVQKITLNNVKTAIEGNRVDLIERQMQQLRVIVEKYDVDEVQCLYYMLQSFFHPAECVNDYENQHEDRYWQTYWAAIAYRKVGNISRSEEVLTSELDKWHDIISEENVFILAALNAVLDENLKTAQSLLTHISGAFSEPLSNLVECLYLYINPTISFADESKLMQFYGDNLFDAVRKHREHELVSAKAEEERQARKAEEAARLEEERRRKEEEARKVAEAEERRRTAEEAARLAEAKAREAEAERLCLEAEEAAYRLDAERRRREKEEMAVEEVQAHWPKFCNKCGQSIAHGQKYCNKCGNLITLKM